MGARFHRHRHRQAAGRESQSAGRRGGGLAASSLALLDQEGMLPRTSPRASKASDARVLATPRARRPGSAWTCWAATICFNTVEAKKRGSAEAGELEGPDQADLQGHDRDAAPGFQRHRLSSMSPPGCRCGASKGLEVHGRPAREHRAVHAFGLQALQAGRRRASSRSASPSSIRAHQSRQRARRSIWCFPRRAWAGTSRPPGVMKARRSMEQAKKLADWMASKEAIKSRRTVGLSSPCPASREAGRHAGNYEKLLKNDFNWAAKTASASWPSGASATTASRKPK